MKTFIAFYRGRTHHVEADSSYSAQQKAAAYFKAKKSYEVTVMLTDVVVDTASL